MELVLSGRTFAGVHCQQRRARAKHPWDDPHGARLMGPMDSTESLGFLGHTTLNGNKSRILPGNSTGKQLWTLEPVAFSKACFFSNGKHTPDSTSQDYTFFEQVVLLCCSPEPVPTCLRKAPMGRSPSGPTHGAHGFHGVLGCLGTPKPEWKQIKILDKT
jgi:hypothetical protein